MTAALIVKDVKVAAAGSVVVRETSFSVARGENLTILGETGSGKSLLAQAIMGTLPFGLEVDGAVEIDGHPSKASDTKARQRLWGRRLALLPQEPWLSLDPTMRSLDQVAEGFHDHTQAAARGKALEALRGLGLAGAERKFPFQLSGGMAQRVTLAATGTAASVLIVDEPTKGLDAGLRESVVALLRTVAAGGRTLLTITHDVKVARALGGTVMVMLAGEIVEQGPAEDVLARPRHAYTRRLLAAEPGAWPVRSAPAAGAALITATNIAKSYGEKRLFTGLDLRVHAAQRWAVTGPSGAGKTTVGNILLGLVRPDAGTVVREGRRPATAFQKLYQDPVAAFAARVSLRQSFSDVMALHEVDPKELERLMARLRLAEALLDRRPSQVSGGELQRFAMIRLLLLAPAFIFADEPTSRLDLISQRETIDLLLEHTEERGCALLLVTHDGEIARNVAGEHLVAIGCAAPGAAPPAAQA